MCGILPHVPYIDSKIPSFKKAVPLADIMKILLSIIFLVIYNIGFCQTLITKICDKSYSKNSIISDTSRVLFGHIDPLFDGACSWRCNSKIITPNRINDGLDMSDSFDFNVNTVCLINNPIKKKISYKVYLSRYSSIIDSIESTTQNDTIVQNDSSEVHLRGLLIANGNRKTKQQYFAYSRIEKLVIYIDNELIGYAYIKDTPKIQYVDFGKSVKLSIDKKVDLIIEIDKIYIGDKSDSLAISELQLDGFGGHSLTEKFCWTK